MWRHYWETLKHKGVVLRGLLGFACRLVWRGIVHDLSKFGTVEAETFVEYVPKLKGSTYGSPEYAEFLEGMKKGLTHHYRANSHHPEHYRNGMYGMDLVDVVEMYVDWAAAVERHANGNLFHSIVLNQYRFGYPSMVKAFFSNTRSGVADWHRFNEWLSVTRRGRARKGALTETYEIEVGETLSATFVLVEPKTLVLSASIYGAYIAYMPGNLQDEYPTLKHYLVEADQGYLFEGLAREHPREFQAGATLEAMREDVQRLQANDELTVTAAEYCQKRLANYTDDNAPQDALEFGLKMVREEAILLSLMYEGSPLHLPWQRQVPTYVEDFFQEIWPVFREVLRQEVQEYDAARKQPQD